MARSEDGYRLWLRYDRITDKQMLQQYRAQLKTIYFKDSTETLRIAKKELLEGLRGLLGGDINSEPDSSKAMLIIHVSNNAGAPNPDAALQREGFHILSARKGKNQILRISASSELGILYGIFHLLRQVQTNQRLQGINFSTSPRLQRRILNHWDNLDRHVERGYAGFSIWNWHTLPGYIDQRYVDYARANASIGINGTVLTNVNANALILSPQYLAKVAALANTFRPYGIRVYLTARFSAPIELGRMKTADPLDSAVRNWWKEKAREIYSLIPDFGGFLVKANSEGQPGPQNYGRSHADGANMLAEAVEPYNGIVMWRAFVYSNESPEDRFRQAYSEFKPLDGKFRKNVMVQVKNGPIDFQPREPISPLFGAMPKTPLMMEFQITQEYLGQATHLVYEAPMFREILMTDTHQQGDSSFVYKVVDGSLHNHHMSGMAGVSNIGNDRNWTGHLFGQANWYTYGRLCWDPQLEPEPIAEEWSRQTFGNDEALVGGIKKIMMSSYETMVNYMTPLGLHHIMGTGHHYGPAPWVSNAGRDDWNPVYYHRANKDSIGFNRTASGNNALSQFAAGFREKYDDPATCPEEFLLWFHRLSWDHQMKSGRTLWEELCHRYYAGVDSVKEMRSRWNALKGKIDEERFNHVSMLLNLQVEEAQWWRNACVLYFQSRSGRPLPAGFEKPDKTLEYYMGLRFPYAPGRG